MIHPISTTPEGIEVYVDLINSDASKSIARQPQLIGFAKEILTGRKLSGSKVQIEQNMGRAVGYDFVVDTPEDDNVFYAQVARENTYTRFIKCGKPLATQYVTVVLERSDDKQTYELQDIRIGRSTPPRPGTPQETSASREYWATHAFVQEGQVLQPRTITKDCPY